MNVPFEAQQRKLLADYLQDLCCEVDSPQAVSVLVEVILRLQHPRSGGLPAAPAITPQERIAP